MRTYWRIRVPDSIRFGYDLLDKKSKQKLWISGIALSLIGLLDLMALGILAITVSVALDAINSQPTSSRVLMVLSFLNIEKLNIYSIVIVLIISMVILFVFKTFFSLYFNSKIYKFLAHQNNTITSKTLKKLLNQDLQKLHKFTSQETLFALTNGLNASIVNLNGLIITTCADIFLSLVMITAIVAFSPLAAFISILLGTVLGLILYKIFNARIRDISLKSATANIESNTQILEVLETFRESVVRDTRRHYIDKISQLRAVVSDSIAAQAILPNIGKYTMELTIMVGGVLVSALMFVLFDANKALTGLSIFVVAGSRISPSFLRIQQNILTFRLNQAWAETSKKLYESIAHSPVVNEIQINDGENKDFDSNILINNLNFTYNLSNQFGLKNVNLDIPTGSFTAIVGTSGSGKTTLVDLILGLLKPDSGSITISGEPPLVAHKKWPGSVAYVPQDVVVINDSIVSNICLGFDVNRVNLSQVKNCLKLANLVSVVDQLPNKLNEKLGEKGFKLSGGQRQRVGIARALYTNPKILVLDEATSALDAESEKDINESLQELKGKITIIVIAHRLSSVVKADKVIYLENGRVLATGTFDEVRNASDNFNNQAILMGL